MTATTAVILVVGVLAARNVAGEWLVPAALYVPVNLGTAALLVMIGRASGLSARQLGLSRATLRPGLVVGGIGAALVVVGVVLGAVVPLTRPWFEDERVADVDSLADLAYQALVRIPLGTALLEELAFRGVLLALLARVRPIGTAVTVSSVLFGLWHIRPTLGALATNDLAQSAWSQAGAVTGAVVLTTVGGFVFCGLRLGSRSLLAPLIVHASANSAATVAAWIVLRGT
ncbi:MAG TPA: CPBP family intramembrane glutamic endopeptidase [Acidimicrobiales bacterium]|nr:CPBP family intramembrane glutamic endopeptidase [Acidimicrobiales bacterium]